MHSRESPDIQSPPDDMSSVQLFCLLALICGALAAKNGICDKSVAFHSDPDAPVMLLVDEKREAIADLSGNEVTYCVYALLGKQAGDRHHILTYYSKEGAKKYEIGLMVLPDSKSTRIYAKDVVINFSVAPAENEWAHLCITWSSATGVLLYYINGSEVGKKEDLAKGGKIEPGALTLGQEQDDYLGDWDPIDGVRGQLTQFNAWKRALTANEVKQAMKGKLFGDLVDWRNSYWTLDNHPVIMESTAPNANVMWDECNSGVCDAPNCKKKDDKTGKSQSTDLSICLRFDGDSFNEESFKLFSYENRCEVSQLSLIIHGNRSTSLMLGKYKNDLLHLAIHPGWQHWCFVWSNDTMNVYIDGALYDVITGFEVPEPWMSVDGDIYIHEANSRQRINPKATNYVIWERALSKEEVYNEYKHGAAEVKAIYIPVPIAAAAGPQYQLVPRSYWRPHQMTQGRH